MIPKVNKYYLPVGQDEPLENCFSQSSSQKPIIMAEVMLDPVRQ